MFYFLFIFPKIALQSSNNTQIVPGNLVHSGMNPQGAETERIDLLEKNIYDIETVRNGDIRVGYLANVKTTTVEDLDDNKYTALLCYFYTDEGTWFKAYYRYDPYFYIAIHPDFKEDFLGFLEKNYKVYFKNVEEVKKINLEEISHMAGDRATYFKISFDTIPNLVSLRKKFMTEYERLKRQKTEPNINNLFSCIIDIREYDVLYHTRVMIDRNIRVSYWYKITFKNNFIDTIDVIEGMNDRPEFVILAYDIECSKAPLKFPDAKVDCIMLISYVINGDGFLITNREIISEEIENFEYTPNEAFKTTITVFNEPTEQALLVKFLEHIKEVKPFIITSFNGDRFDWPYVDQRMQKYGIKLEKEIGVGNFNEEYFGRYTVHMDCFYWVERDSYLPQGSHGLKAVTKAKLHYDPIEVDPEDMVPFARQRPHILCQYSVSDAVATYYLYMKHIHDFIFALCTIIPLGPDDVLRRGSGTLCENLLMAEAFVKNIIFPNKVVGEEERFYNGHLLESETYIGGRVECMHNGVYRCDIETDFVLDPKAFEELIAKTPDIAKFFVTHELGKSVEDIVNLESVNASIISKLSKFAFMEKPRIISKPLIYHVDVAAMYPNIILTNRLQPVSIVNEKICSGCVYNNIENNCKRVMEWQWKGEFYPLNRGEFERIKLLHHTDPNLSKLEDNLALRKEVKEYSQKHYKQTYDHKTEMRYDTVCMRENPFYVDTVKAFRDRRYEFKAKVKVWAKTLQKFKDDPDESKKAHNMMLLYESLQLAHKIILNSFYGYVMRKGARWYSMEMAAMVTHTGSEIIQHARNLFVRIGKPLELDTDGIWTLLPAGFPETFDLEFRDGSKSTLSFPCSMCNLLIYDRYKNTQYQMERVDRPKKFTTTTEMSIFFEIDGPHRAMVIPAAREENKVLKKRYAVFDMKGKLSEVKGFEIKRRGELKIIKIFQSEIFSQYLKGATLQECYNYCAETCNKWLGILRQQGQGMRDEEVIDLIAESKVLSKNIKEYDGRKGVAITAAKRMSEFLGADLLEGKGLNCHFVVTKKPTTSPLNERVIPVSIFNIKEDAIKMKFLRKWLKEPKLETHQATLKEIVDWEYYIERLSNTMQKMVTICAAYQGIANPVPFIAHPKWLEQKIARESSNNPQTKLQSFFQVKTKDIEDMDVEKPYISKNPNRRAEFERNEGGKKSARASTKKDEEDFVPTTKLQENFPVWLTEQKKLWRLNRQRRKAGMLPASSHRRDKELGSFFKHSHLQLQNMTLQVLSVTRTKIPGEFNLWIVLENSFTSIKVRVDRTIYINTTNPKLDLGENFKKSSKILPRDKKSLALYECTIPEVHFQKLEKNFELHLTNKTIEGVYETKVDLLFRLATKVGAHTKLAQGVTTREQGTYEIKDLVSFGTAGPSEPIDKSKLHLVYIFIVPFNDERAILFLNERACKITVILFHKRKITDFAHIKKVIQNGLVKSNRRSDYAIDFIQEVNIQSEMEKILSMVIKITEETLSRNFVLCVDGYGVFKSFFESVEENHPIIVLRNTDAGRCYQKASSLDWHIWAINQICEAIQFSEQNLDDRMAISQQLNIPVGCLPEKWEVFSTDLMFSRLLNKHNLIHWASNNGIPDRGMGEVEKESLLNLVETQLNYEEKVKMIFCSNYCIDVPLEDFDLAAVINFEEIVKNDKELSIMMELSSDSAGDSCFSKTAFKAVRELLLLILSGKMKADERVAKYGTTGVTKTCFEQLLSNFSSWISDNKSIYYDHQLMNMLNKLVLQMKRKIANDLKERNIKIISISPSRLIIDTGKRTYQPAYGYWDYVNSVTQKLDLMKQIGHPKRPAFWRLLFYQSPQKMFGIQHGASNLDCSWKEISMLPSYLSEQVLIIMSNFISVIEEISKTILAEAIEDLGELTEVDMIKLNPIIEERTVAYFNNNTVNEIFKAFDNCRESLREYEAEKEIAMNKKEHDEVEKLASHSAKKKKQKEEHGYSDAEGEEENEYDEMDSFIEDDEDLADEGHKRTPKKKRKRDAEKAEEDANKFEKPTFPGDIHYDKSPMLLFVDILLEFFGSVGFLQDDYQRLSNYLNDMVGRAATVHQSIHEHILNSKLEAVSCKGCNTVSQFDIFKNYDYRMKVFICSTCMTPFNTFSIESKIIEWVNSMASYFAFQDLQCAATSEPRVDCLSFYSDRQGEYKAKSYRFSQEFEWEVSVGFRDLSIIARDAGMRNLDSLLTGLNSVVGG